MLRLGIYGTERMHARTYARTRVREKSVKETLKNMLRKTKNPQISIISEWVRCLYGLGVKWARIVF